MKVNFTTLFFIIVVFLVSNVNAQTFQWVKQMGGTSIEEGKSITTDAFGNIYTTGYFWNTADFDPGSNVYNLNSFGIRDVFINKLDVAGNFVWAKQMGGGK